MEKMIKSIVEQISSKITKKPEIAVILGSGLSDILDDIQNKTVIPYADLNGMPLVSVEGHKNQFVCGDLGNKYVIAMQGRFHLYNGFTAKQVAMPIYLFKELGVKTLILTNAAGGVNDNFNPGDIAVITDHINRTGTNCMIGGPIIDYGTQFIDMTKPYCEKYIDICEKLAKEDGFDLKKGTYIQFAGPFYETKAEITMAKSFGVDLVGMSTVLEVEAANHCRLNVLALSVITNKAAGLSKTVMEHKEVLSASQSVSRKLVKLIKKFVVEI